MSIEILSNLVITRVRSASTLYTPKNTKMKRKDRPCWAIMLKYEGETIYSIGDKHFLSDSHHILILPRGCSYDWHCTQAGRFCAIDFECDATFPEIISLSITNGDKILKMCKDLEQKRNLKEALTELESIRDVYSILLSLAQAKPRPYLPTEKQERITRAVEYISDHYCDALTNDKLAAIVGISTVYFRKLFTSVMGVSPIAYVHSLRIEKAKEMLKSDYGTLSDVAVSLGYANLYDFSRDFKFAI